MEWRLQSDERKNVVNMSLLSWSVFQNEGELKTISGKKKKKIKRELISSRPTLKEMSEEVLQAEGIYQTEIRIYTHTKGRVLEKPK